MSCVGPTREGPVTGMSEPIQRSQQNNLELLNLLNHALADADPPRNLRKFASNQASNRFGRAEYDQTCDQTFRKKTNLLHPSIGCVWWNQEPSHRLS
jgi:hypothetical protein